MGNRKIKYLISLTLLLVLIGNKNFGQQKDSTILPFAISDEKRLPEDELKVKKEGIYAVAIPNFSSDPINGFGAGAEGAFFYNGKRSDPFFAFTPYRMQLNLGIYITTRSQKQLYLKMDIPYIFNTKWRLRAILGYGKNPNGLYFGINEKTLAPLSYYPDNNPQKPIVNNASYSNYEANLVGGKAFYNTYSEQGGFINPTIERSYNKGRLRILLGYELDIFNYSTPLNDSALLHQDADAKKITGFTNNLISFALAGLIYDTRDLETDPSKGVFAELTNGLSLTALGSQYNFNKTFFHYNIYQPLLPRIFKRLTFAGRIGIGYIQGNAPFFEYMGQWTSEAYISALGGGNTLRGYKQSRFVSRVIEFTNVEARWRFAKLNFLKQNLAFSAVPFFDVGGVWDGLNRLNHTENLRYSEGLGMRIAWNLNTILRFDYAISKEDKQFFFSLGHTF